MGQGKWRLSRASALLLVFAWLPVWGLYALLIGPANPVHPGTSMTAAAVIALRSITVAAVLGFFVKRLTDRVPWPHPFRLSFALIHLTGSLLYAVSWFFLAALIENLIRPGAIHAYFAMLVPNIVLGVWLYVMIAGTIYAARATERAARAEAEMVRAQLAALRAQLNPHFLFNALHAVVHLIAERPRDAARAAEQVAGLLRTAIEEDRDLVSVEEELAFVQRYLDLERLRFGDRLEARIEMSPEVLDEAVPAFAIQALVENAVRHGAAPSEGTTTVTVSGLIEDGKMELTVSDSGAGADLATLATSEGTGLRHLRERLTVLYGGRASLDLRSEPGGGFDARLTIPTGRDA
jgi:signal transduction histidine kinase